MGKTKTLLVNSIKVTILPDGNIELGTLHEGGLVRDGRIVIERADVSDVERALALVQQHMRPKDWNACPFQSHADDCTCGGAGGDR